MTELRTTDGRPVSEDEILSMAQTIKHKRLNQKLFNSFDKKEEVMIRWDCDYKETGQSYAHVMVPKDAVRDLVKTGLGQ